MWRITAYERRTGRKCFAWHHDRQGAEAIAQTCRQYANSGQRYKRSVRIDWEAPADKPLNVHFA